MARIAVVHVPFYSHIQAANRLTGALVGLGHEVTAWAPEKCRHDIEGLGARFEPHEPVMPTWAPTPVAFAAELVDITERETERLIEQLFEAGTDVLVHDSQVPWARVAGDYLGIPRVVSHPMFPFVDPHRRSSPADEAREAARGPDNSRQRFRSGWLSIAQRWGVEIEDFLKLIHSPGERTLAYTTEKIVSDDPVARWMDPRWRFVGPLMPAIPRAQLERSRPLVYVCFGTSFNTRGDLFAMAIEGLADEPYDVLVSTGAGQVMPSTLGDLPANVTVSTFVPALEVLAEASVHVTHGGCNSVHESIIAGVPMVFVPQAYDQFPLAWRVSSLGAGVVARESAFDIRACVRLLLESEKAHSRARRLSDHLCAYDGRARVAALIDEAESEVRGAPVARARRATSGRYARWTIRSRAIRRIGPWSRAREPGL